MARVRTGNPNGRHKKLPPAKLPDPAKVAAKSTKSRASKRDITDIWTPEFEENLLECLRQGASVNDVIESHNISRRTIYSRIRSDEEWKERWEEAIKIGDDAIRDEIRRRAMNGVLEPVYHEGEVVGHKRKYSDILLMFLAKSRMPEFRENNHEHNHTFNFEGIAERFAARIAAIAATREARVLIDESDE